MTIYDTKKTQIAWRGTTLEGFGNEKIHIFQSSGSPSMKTVTGIFFEFFNYPAKRMWTIESEFLLTSPSYKMLLADNLNRREGTLVIRDLNGGSDFTDIFSNCVILSIKDENDGKPVKITWAASRRNLK